MIDPLDYILNKFNNDDLLSDISDNEEDNELEKLELEKLELGKLELEKEKEKIINVYNDIKKCIIEIFFNYLILIDNTKDNDENDNKLIFNKLNNIFFKNIKNDYNNDDMLNIPIYIKELTRKLDHKLICYIDILDILITNIIEMSDKWLIDKEIDFIDYNTKLLIELLNTDEIKNLYLKKISHHC